MDVTNRLTTDSLAEAQRRGNEISEELCALRASARESVLDFDSGIG
jgi:hypothetical protein